MVILRHSELNQKHQHKGMEENKNKPASDEIDIREFLLSIRDGIAKFLNWIFKTFLMLLIFLRNFVVARFKFLMLGGIVGGLLGFGFYSLQSPSYETGITIRSTYLRGLYFNAEVEKLNEYCKNKSYDLLSAELNIPEESLDFIKGFESKNVNNYYNIYSFYTATENLDSVKLAAELGSNLFVITAEVNVESEDATPNLTELEKGLVHYFENNVYINRLYNTELTRLQSRKKKLESELANLDSLKTIIKEKLKKNELTSAASLEISVRENKNDDIVSNPLSIFDQDYKFFQELQQVNTELALLEKVQVVNGFNGVKLNRRAFLIKSVVYGGFYGGVVTIAIFLLLAVNHYLTNEEKKMAAEK